MFNDAVKVAYTALGSSARGHFTGGGTKCSKNIQSRSFAANPLHPRGRTMLSTFATSSLKVCSSPKLPLPSMSITNIPRRLFSSAVPPGLKAFPQYTVFGETCMLTIKVMMPVFRVLRSNTLVVDGSKRGRIVLEWTPRDSEGRPTRDHQIRFALSPEECGLLVDQLPKNQKVEFLRRTQQYNDFPEDGDGPSPDKVLHITPGQAGMVSFKVDFEKDGVGGYGASGNNMPADVAGPLEVVVQTGEYQVIHSLIQTSLPHLVGWTTMMELALSRSVSDSLQQGGAGSGGVGGGQYFSTSGPGNTPF